MEIKKNENNVSEKLAERRRLLLALMLITVVAALAYGNTLGNEFVFDDFKIIRDNTTIRSFSTVPEIFANMFVYHPLKGQGTKIDPSYRPVRYLSYAVDYQFTGLDPTGYHISNIIYHVIASFLVFLVLRRLTGHYAAALGAAMIFVVHPVHSESVAYLTGRKDVLCTIFYLLAFLSFLKYRENPKLRYAIMLPAFFALSFMAKEMAITLPVVMLLYDLGRWLKEKRGGTGQFLRGLLTGKQIAVYLPVILLAFLFSVFALFLKNPAGMGDESLPRWGGSLYISLITMLRGVIHYIRLLFIPVGLTADYSYNTFPVSRSLFVPFNTFLSLLCLAALAAIGIYCLARRFFLAGFAVLFFLVSLVPVIHIVPIPERLAERFLYLPSLGLMILAAIGIKWLMKKNRRLRNFSTTAVIIIIIVFFFLTHYRNRDWKDPLTLHGSVVALYPGCARSQLAVAEGYAMRAAAAVDKPAAARQDYLKAVTHFNQVLRILPPETWQGWRRGYALNAIAGRGIAYGNLGKYDEAIRDLRKVLGETDAYESSMFESGQYLQVHFDLGQAYFAKNEFEKAITMFESMAGLAKQAIEKGDVLEKEKAGDFLARAVFRKALALAAMEKIRAGLVTLQEGLKYAAGTKQEVSIRYQVGLFQLELKEYDNALGSFIKTIELCDQYEESPETFGITDPRSVISGIDMARYQSYYMLARAYDGKGNLKEALKALHKAVELAPGFLPAHFYLGDIYFKRGKLDAAEKEFRRVLKDRPDDQASKQKLLLIGVKRQAIEERKKPAPQKIVLLYQAALRDYGAKDIDKAQDKLLEALKIAGRLEHDDGSKLSTSHVRLLLGRIRYEQGDSDNAKTHLQAGLDMLNGVEADSLDFPFGEGNYWLALTLFKSGKREQAAGHLRKAVPHLRKAAETNKSAVEAVELLLHSAWANETLGNSEEEYKDYARAVEIMPQYPNIHFLAASAALKVDKLAEAYKLLTESIKRKDKVAECTCELGKIMLATRKYTDAIAHFETAIEKTKDSAILAQCYLYMGQSYYGIEFYEEAADAWREYLKHEKDPGMRKAMQQQLAEDPKLKK